METNATMVHQSLNFTENALSKLHGLLSSAERDKACLRIYIVGGGCSGFQYGFTLEETFSPDEDIVFEMEREGRALKVAIDPMSFQYLEGARIDYIENFQGSRFTVDNPHAETTCGCGSSFSLKEDN